MKTGPFTFIAADDKEWRITGLSEACGANYADIERVDDPTRRSVRQAGHLRAVGHEIPNDNVQVEADEEEFNPQVETPLQVAAEHVGVPVKIPAPHPVGCECGNCSHAHYGCLICGSKDGTCTPISCATDDPAPPTFKAGRYVLFNREEDGTESYVTSWDTWDEAYAACFPFTDNTTALRDGETGQLWQARAQVVHNRRHTFDVYIGRPGPWGNPYSHVPEAHAQHIVGSREEAIELYRAWLKDRIRAQEPGLVEALAALHGKTLGCWCAPEPCHGDVLADAAEWSHNLLNPTS